MSEHPDSKLFHEILREVADLYSAKQSDYGRDESPFANVEASEDFGVPSWVGTMIRANDKMRRVQKAASQAVRGEEISLRNEGLEDSLLDLAVYSLIGLVLLRNGNKNKGQDPLPF